jgi:hypothetical protein
VRLMISERYSQFDIFMSCVANRGGEAATSAALRVGQPMFRYMPGDLIQLYLLGEDVLDDDMMIETSTKTMSSADSAIPPNGYDADIST